jgi:adenosylmethionine-8-amino-7-oxononanoate aminotransferase
MGAVDLVRDGDRADLVAPATGSVSRRPRHAGPGVFARPLGDAMVLMPPLTSSEGELRQLAAVLQAAVVEVLGA